jgi:hypothetical protein
MRSEPLTNSFIFSVLIVSNLDNKLLVIQVSGIDGTQLFPCTKNGIQLFISFSLFNWQPIETLHC